ncbi:MAG: winged helix-turn-helix domain-containing protein [Planctomycetaceae bacterium]
MATDVLENGVDTIGVAAGQIWQYLHDQGPAAVSKLVKDMDLTRDQLMQGLGWLAREGKIQFQDGPRSKLVALKL